MWSIIIFIVDNHKSILRRLTMSSNVGAKLPIGGNSSLASKKHSGNIEPNAPGHAKTNGLVITSEDVNVLVYRYLQESGKLSFINILVFPGCFRGSFSISVSRKLKPYVRLLSFFSCYLHLSIESTVYTTCSVLVPFVVVSDFFSYCSHQICCMKHFTSPHVCINLLL